MKPIKFIIFAHPSTPCSPAGNDNFVKHLLKTEFYVKRIEHAIGFKPGAAQHIRLYDESYDIFVFADTSAPPSADDIFFKSFAESFFEAREQFEFKIILHRSSDWEFKDLPTLQYAEYRKVLEWLASLKENEGFIYQSHRPDDVYGSEMIAITNAILQDNPETYEQTLVRLNERFKDNILESFLEKFAKQSPLTGDWDEELYARQAELFQYLNLPKPSDENSSDR